MNPDLHAYVTVSAERARDQARRLTAEWTVRRAEASTFAEGFGGPPEP